jgi:hypothetical protein
MVSDNGKKRSQKRKTGQVRKSNSIKEVPINSVYPSPENDKIYRPIDQDSPDIVELAESISQNGLKEPIVVTLDGWIVSGHRRYAACQKAGLENIRVRYENINRADDLDKFVELLVEYNTQRKKSFDEEVRELLIKDNPGDSWHSIKQERSQTACTLEEIDIQGVKVRSRISDAKLPFLNAVLDILKRNWRYLPLTNRQIHYELQNDPPLKHASKPDSVYRNEKPDYKNLCDLLTRARTAGIISMDAIADPTRPISVWECYQGPRHFIANEQKNFLNMYSRDLMQSQPDHIEILAEKNTIQPTINRVAQDYCIPTTSGRGYCSLTPRSEMVRRYEKSGKNKLIVLIVSDFDPDGEEIAHSFARSIRDDFGIDKVHPIKVAINHDHIEQFNLIPNMEAKKTSAQYKKFFDRYGTDDVFEVEALRPDQLEELLRDAINDVIDLERYNHEVEQEREEGGKIIAYRQAVFNHIKDFDFDKLN